MPGGVWDEVREPLEGDDVPVPYLGRDRLGERDDLGHELVTGSRYPVGSRLGATVRAPVAVLLVIQFQDYAPLGALEGPLRERGHELVEWRLDRAEARPASLDGVGGVIALGGRMDPDQDAEHPWLADVRDVLAEAVERGIPTLGLCLGGQLLAQSLGGRAGPVAEPEIGWFEVEVEPAAAGDPLLAGLATTQPAFLWHHYGFTLPPGATLLARTPRAAQAFRVGDLTWGLQFHIEVDGPIAQSWIVLGRSELVGHGLDPDALARESQARAAPYLDASHALAAGFADVVERESIASAAR
jgi:GMP synthase-like glutamine amidotransferase